MLPFSVFIYTEPRSVHSKPRSKSSAVPESAGSHPAVLSPYIAGSLSNALLFMDFRSLCAQRSTATPLQSTVCTLFPVQRRGRRYAKAFQRSFQSACQCPLLPLCFQQLPRCPSRNPFLFRLLHCCRGWVGGANARPSQEGGSNRSSSGSALSPLECAVPRFHGLSALECAVAKRRPRNSFRMRSSEKRWGGGGSRSLERHSPEWRHLFAVSLFSITYELPSLQVLCFDKDPTVPGVCTPILLGRRPGRAVSKQSPRVCGR